MDLSKFDLIRIVIGQGVIEKGMMYKDFTIKAKLTDPESIEKKLFSLNALFKGTDYQTDYYFETDRGKLKLRQGNIENLITHYERIVTDDLERTIVYRYEINPAPEEVEALKQSRRQIGVTSKSRKIFILENIKIHLDTVREGEFFIEIEAIDREGRFAESDLKGQCLWMKEELNLRDEDLMRTGYFNKPDLGV